MTDAAGRPKILAFAGSTPEGSQNKRLIEVAAEAARAAGAEVTLIDLRDYPLPPYDGDVEANQGFPAAAVDLKDLFKAHDGFLISALEYNGGISGMLKSTFDWVSRRGDDDGRWRRSAASSPASWQHRRRARRHPRPRPATPRADRDGCPGGAATARDQCGAHGV